MIEINNVKIHADSIEPEALAQIIKLSSHPIAEDSTIRIMPDVHAGKGSVVGLVMHTKKKMVIPNIVGVDIGCGVKTFTLPSLGNKTFEEIDEFIHQNIPAGKEIHKESQMIKYLTGKEKNDFTQLARKVGEDVDYMLHSMGTLGGGNHFIEIEQYRNADLYCLTVHSGSRHFGLKVASYHQKKAEKMLNKNDLNVRIAELKEKYSGYELGQKIKEAKDEIKNQNKKVPKDLAYLEGNDFDEYIHDMQIVQQFAARNRSLILHPILQFIGITPYDTIESIHNYIEVVEDGYITRKGAIAAYDDQDVIIPINMKSGIIIGVGLGNEDFLFSAPHGAGRKMSRSKAKTELSMDKFKEIMDGIYSTSVSESTLDESPMAYKNIRDIAPYLLKTVSSRKYCPSIFNFKA